MVSYYFIYILTFFITAIWDILLRVMSENYDTLPKFLKWFDFMKYLQPYFKNHTLLGAALIAGFIFGARSGSVIGFIAFLGARLVIRIILKSILPLRYQYETDEEVDEEDEDDEEYEEEDDDDAKIRETDFTPTPIMSNGLGYFIAMAIAIFVVVMVMMAELLSNSTI